MSSGSRPRRQLGDILLDLEPLLEELVDDQGCQYGDILALVYQHLEVHLPHAKEKYVLDNSSPVFYYGHRDELHRNSRKKHGGNK